LLIICFAIAIPLKFREKFPTYTPLDDLLVFWIIIEIGPMRNGMLQILLEDLYCHTSKEKEFRPLDRYELWYSLTWLERKARNFRKWDWLKRCRWMDLHFWKAFRQTLKELEIYHPDAWEEFIVDRQEPRLDELNVVELIREYCSNQIYRFYTFLPQDVDFHLCSQPKFFSDNEFDHSYKWFKSDLKSCFPGRKIQVSVNLPEKILEVQIDGVGIMRVEREVLKTKDILAMMQRSAETISSAKKWHFFAEDDAILLSEKARKALLETYLFSFVALDFPNADQWAGDILKIEKNMRGAGILWGKIDCQTPLPRLISFGTDERSFYPQLLYELTDFGATISLKGDGDMNFDGFVKAVQHISNGFFELHAANKGAWDDVEWCRDFTWVRFKRHKPDLFLYQDHVVQLNGHSGNESIVQLIHQLNLILKKEQCGFMIVPLLAVDLKNPPPVDGSFPCKIRLVWMSEEKVSKLLRIGHTMPGFLPGDRFELEKRIAVERWFINGWSFDLQKISNLADFRLFFKKLCELLHQHLGLAEPSSLKRTLNKYSKAEGAILEWEVEGHTYQIPWECSQPEKNITELLNRLNFHLDLTERQERVLLFHSLYQYGFGTPVNLTISSTARGWAIAKCATPVSGQDFFKESEPMVKRKNMMAHWWKDDDLVSLDFPVSSAEFSKQETLLTISSPIGKWRQEFSLCVIDPESSENYEPQECFENVLDILSNSIHKSSKENLIWDVIGTANQKKGKIYLSIQPENEKSLEYSCSISLSGKQRILEKIPKWINQILNDEGVTKRLYIIRRNWADDTPTGYIYTSQETMEKITKLGYSFRRDQTMEIEMRDDCRCEL
jgi:hypothetical protein